MRHDNQGDRPTWHPIMHAHEREPGVWDMITQEGRPYGSIRIIRRGDEVGYRATGGLGQSLGYYTNLRAACAAAYRYDRQPLPRWPNNDEEIARARMNAESAPRPPGKG